MGIIQGSLHFAHIHLQTYTRYAHALHHRSCTRPPWHGHCVPRLCVRRRMSVFSTNLDAVGGISNNEPASTLQKPNKLRSTVATSNQKFATTTSTSDSTRTKKPLSTSTSTRNSTTKRKASTSTTKLRLGASCLRLFVVSFSDTLLVKKTLIYMPVPTLTDADSTSDEASSTPMPTSERTADTAGEAAGEAAAASEALLLLKIYAFYARVRASFRRLFHW